MNKQIRHFFIHFLTFHHFKPWRIWAKAAFHINKKRKTGGSNQDFLLNL